MGQMRCTQFFTSAAYGWSETIWSTAENPTDAMRMFITLAGLRFRLLGSGVNSPYLRVSDDAVLRDAAIVNLDFSKTFFAIDKLSTFRDDAPRFAKGIALNTPADQPYSAILVRMQAGTLSHRMCYMRGCPDEIIVNPPGPVEPPVWATAFKNYADELNSGRWFYLRLDRNPGTNPFKPVTNFAGGDPNWVVTCPAHGFQTGDSIHADKFIGTDMPRGDYTALVLTADTLKLKEYFSQTAVYLRGGRLQKNVRTLGQINSVVIRSETHRDTGLPFDRPRGRRVKR